MSLVFDRFATVLIVYVTYILASDNISSKLRHLESTCKYVGVFPKASQNWIIARNLKTPPDIMISKFLSGNTVAKLVSHSARKLYHCCLQEMMS